MEVLSEIFDGPSMNDIDNRSDSPAIELQDGSLQDNGLQDSLELDNTSLSFDNPKKTKNILSKYERTRILGARATLLSKGAQPLVNPDGETNPLEIARMELSERVIPIVIRRHLPNGEYEDWRLQDLI